jgi:hypothetical protein
MNLHLEMNQVWKRIQMERIYVKERESGLNNDLMEAVTKLAYHQLQKYILTNCTSIFES